MQLFLTAFQSIPDPRAENTRHNLAELLIIAFLAVLCGATSCAEMAEFGRAKLKFLKRFLKLRHGIPSHDTFSNVFRVLDPKSLDAAFAGLAAKLVAALMVSAYATGLRLALATVAAIDRNEVEAALEVLGLIDLKGKIVTADALHCNRKMAEKIIAKGGDYCLTLKGNQESLLSDARSCLGKVGPRHPTAKTQERGHGRIETRVGMVVAAKGLATHHEFPGLKAFGRIEATREIDGKIEKDVRIFALSRQLPVDEFIRTARAHWQIENALHWELDVAMREDDARNRKDHGPASIAVLRRRARDLVVCWACSVARGCKSPTQPDGGEGLARTQGLSPRGGV